MHRRRLEADLGAIVLAELRDEFAVMGFDALEAFEKIDVKIGAAEFAVGDSLQPHALLSFHDLADALVLDRVQLLRRHMAGGKALARLPQSLRAKIAADMVGAERQTGHDSSLEERARVALAQWSHAAQGLGNPRLRRSRGKRLTA